MSLLSVLFHLPNCVSVLIFSQDIWGNVHYVPEIKRNLRHGFVDERQLKTLMSK